MKSTIKTLILAAFLAFSTEALIGQGAPPPPPSSHGSSTNQPAGGGAPIECGVGILLALGAAYGARKVYQLRKKEEIND
ncbi:MAG: hypothetical protein LWX09_07310 [Bacteroidia bacterium]|nr:hypothetical protein [Bacteroidia bacterium]